jgi:hypothetical protein
MLYKYTEISIKEFLVIMLRRQVDYFKYVCGLYGENTNVEWLA